MGSCVQTVASELIPGNNVEYRSEMCCSERGVGEEDGGHEMPGWVPLITKKKA